MSGRPADSIDTPPTSESTDDDFPTRPADPQTLALAQIRDPDRYLILNEHGRGGLGRVSRAHDRELGRDVALKEVLSRNQISEARFLREALITARLEHPGIVAVHEAGRWPDGTPFYTMKLVSGRSLREMIAERTSVDERLGLLHHVIAVADAIAYAHGRHIVHRDLKPANIIIGDFGETVVIDWGLAKDLTVIEESNPDGGSLRVDRDSQLTMDGAVLGTPAYMAPEQERGEQVDERADVFAIGVMLSQLCMLEKVPLSNPSLRHRLLRRANIDKDLIAIIGKALDPDPQRRYLHAGMLAADLKAFKAGARIGARSYSPFALLTHWIRRHRTLAITITAATVLATAGIVFYVRSIAVERDRANTAQAEAVRQRQVAENGRSELILQHSELLLHSDPTAAARALASYSGPDQVRRRQLLAEAAGLGVASAVLTPHRDTVWFLVGDADGGIVSLGEDRKIRRTRGTQTTTLADDVSAAVLYDYTPGKQALAYTTSPSGVAVLDITTFAVTRLRTGELAAMAIGPDGDSLATLDPQGMITVWSIASGKALRKQLATGASDLKWATPTRLVIQGPTSVQTLSLDPEPAPPHTAQLRVRALDARANDLIVGDDAGTITLLSATLETVAQLSVCRRRINSIRFIADQPLATFACLDGLVGIVRFDRAAKTLTETAVFSTLGAALAATPDVRGHWIAVQGETNVAYVYDIQRRLVHRLEGQPGRISFIAPPSPGVDSFVVGDVNGTVRVWPLPSLAGRTILEAPRPVFNVAFTPDSKQVITDGGDGIVRRIAVAGNEVRELRGHDGMATGVVLSPDGDSIASVGSDRTIHVWRASDGASLRAFAGHASDVNDAAYIDGGRRIVSIGDDGSLLAWSTTGSDQVQLFKRPTPLALLEIIPGSEHIVVADAANAVWVIAPSAPARLVRAASGAAVTRLRASPDGRLFAIGTDQGQVAVYDTATWKVTLALTVSNSAHRIAFDPSGRDLAIASEDGHLHVFALDARRTLPWREVSVGVRDVAYSPDGETIAFICADGGTWFYGVRDDAWVYTRDHSSDTTSGGFSPDGRWFASCDRRGVVTLRDVAATFTEKVRAPTISPQKGPP